MKKTGCSGKTSIVDIIAVVLTLVISQPAHAEKFADGLINRVRAAARMIPGDLPVEVRFQRFVSYTGQLSSWVENAPSRLIPGVVGIFQIRYPDGWIIVDGGADKEMIQWEAEFSDENYELVGAAIRGANLIIATHEHADHIGGIVGGRWTIAAAGRTLLTNEQLKTLVEGPDHPAIQITQEVADNFLSVSYNELLPIAKGIVLIKAPGHSAGSQFVYVKIYNGPELLLIGDAVWVTAALESGAQRPLDLSFRIGEDRNALAEQIQWLHQVRKNGPYIVAAHDAVELEALVKDGVIKDGVYLGRLD